jgi:hypothetical protein
MAQLLMAYVNVMSDGVVFYVMLQVAQEKEPTVQIMACVIP